MIDALFQSTTIPAMEQVVNFTEARHNVLAGNVANVDTPGYQARDISVEDFQTRLKEALDARRGESQSASEAYGPPGRRLAEVADNPKTILHHDQSKVGMEFQVTEMVKNQLHHNTALAIMTSQFRLLQAAISERA